MRKLLWIVSGLILLGAMCVAVFYIVPGWRAKLPWASLNPKHTTMADEDADLPPIPYISLQINRTDELETFAGVPLLLIVRFSNPRAMNAAAENFAREQLIKETEVNVTEGKLSAEQAKPILANMSRKKEVRPLQLGDTSHAWNESVQFATLGADGKPSPLSWQGTLLDLSVAKSVALDAKKTAELKYALAPNAASGIAPGDYQVVARLVIPETGVSGGAPWRGEVTSSPVKIKISPLPSHLNSPQEETMNLDFARYYFASGDRTKALEHVKKSLAVNAESIAALTMSGEIKEAQGDNAGALEAYQSALGAFRKQHPRAYEQPLPLLNRVKALMEK